MLSLSPALMEKYLTAAEKVARAALFGPEASKPTLARLTPADAGRSSRARCRSSTTTSRASACRNAFHATHRVPVDGEYVIRVVPGGTRPPGPSRSHVALWIDGEQVEVVDLDPEGVATFELDQQDLFGTRREFRVR